MGPLSIRVHLFTIHIFEHKYVANKKDSTLLNAEAFLLGERLDNRSVPVCNVGSIPGTNGMSVIAHVHCTVRRHSYCDVQWKYL